MAILEELLEEVKLLNKNLRVTNTELSTVDETTLKEVVKEAPMKHEETQAEKPTETDTEEKQNYTKDEVLTLGKKFVQKADDTDKKAFKDKLDELGAGKLSNVTEEHFTEIVDFMNARLSA